MKYPVHNSNGYTLYVVLILLAIAAILFSVTFAELRATRVFAKREIQRSQATLLAESGLVKTEFFLNGGDGHSITWETPNYTEPFGNYGTLHIAIERFGLWSRVYSTGKRMVTSVTIPSLFGRTIPDDISPTLTLTGHVGGLILHQGSALQGDIVLHHGYVYAQKKGQPLPDYTRRLTFKESPPLPFDTLLLPALLASLDKKKNSFTNNDPDLQGVITITTANDSLLKKHPLIIRGDCKIATPRCDSAFIIVSGACVVEAPACVKGGLIFAKTITCNGGTTEASLFIAESSLTLAAGNHASQYYAYDSLLIKREASFTDGTICGVVRSPVKRDSLATATRGIYLEEAVRFTGVLLCVTSQGVNRHQVTPSITIGKHTVITGAIITDADCSFLDCTINGNVWARAIVANDDSTMYTNFLIRSTITPAAVPYPFPLLGKGPLEIVRVGGK